MKCDADFIPAFSGDKQSGVISPTVCRWRRSADEKVCRLFLAGAKAERVHRVQAECKRSHSMLGRWNQSAVEGTVQTQCYLGLLQGKQEDF